LIWGKALSGYCNPTSSEEPKIEKNRYFGYGYDEFIVSVAQNGYFTSNQQ